MPKKWILEIEQEQNEAAFGPNYDPLVDDPLAQMDEEGCDEVHGSIGKPTEPTADACACS